MAPRARANQSYTWAQVKSVQSLIERCLNQYMTQAEIIATLQVQADVEPALTCLVWSKLEEQNPDFFLSYDIQLRLKDQIARPRVPLRARARAARFRFRRAARGGRARELFGSLQVAFNYLVEQQTRLLQKLQFSLPAGAQPPEAWSGAPQLEEPPMSAPPSNWD